MALKIAICLFTVLIATVSASGESEFEKRIKDDVNEAMKYSVNYLRGKVSANHFASIKIDCKSSDPKFNGRKMAYKFESYIIANKWDHIIEVFPDGTVKITNMTIEIVTRLCFDEKNCIIRHPSFWQKLLATYKLMIKFPRFSLKSVTHLELATDNAEYPYVHGPSPPVKAECTYPRFKGTLEEIFINNATLTLAYYFLNMDMKNN